MTTGRRGYRADWRRPAFDPRAAGDAPHDCSATRRARTPRRVAFWPDAVVFDVVSYVTVLSTRMLRDAAGLVHHEIRLRPVAAAWQRTHERRLLRASRKRCFLERRAITMLKNHAKIEGIGNPVLRI